MWTSVLFLSADYWGTITQVGQAVQCGKQLWLGWMVPCIWSGQLATVLSFTWPLCPELCERSSCPLCPHTCVSAARAPITVPRVPTLV